MVFFLQEQVNACFDIQHDLLDEENSPGEKSPSLLEPPQRKTENSEIIVSFLFQYFLLKDYTIGILICKTLWNPTCNPNCNPHCKPIM